MSGHIPQDLILKEPGNRGYLGLDLPLPVPSKDLSSRVQALPFLPPPPCFQEGISKGIGPVSMTVGTHHLLLGQAILS